MNEQEYFMQMQMLGQEAEKIEQQVQMIDQQNMELMAVRESVAAMKDNKNKEILANLGKGIFVKADIKDENLFVNVFAMTNSEKYRCPVSKIKKNSIATSNSKRINTR